MPVRAIWAQSATGAIGSDGGIPWHVPEDMALFKAATVGHPVVMGRKTWDSFPPRWRPLPERTNIVVTRDRTFTADGADVVDSVPAAIERARALDEEVWIIGGAEIYRQAMPMTDELWVTRIDLDVDGDVAAPEIDEAWTRVRSDPAAGWHTSRTGTRYRLDVYRR